MTSTLAQLNAQLGGVIAGVHERLVAIDTGRGHGAGTIWHEDGLIITNAHVIARAHRPTVILPDGGRYPAQIIARSDALDLAALAIDAHDLPTMPVGDSTALQPGEWVLAAGHPWGVRGAVTQGVVIGTGNNLAEQPLPGREWVAMSLHLRPGHSGGPVVNTHGELVGVNTIMAGPEVGMAVPAHVAKRFLKDTLGTRPEPAPGTPPNVRYA